MGAVNDKDISGMVALLPRNASYYACAAKIPRALNAEAFCNILVKNKLNATPFSSVEEAYLSAQQTAGTNDMILITGSFFVIAEVLEIL